MVGAGEIPANSPPRLQPPARWARSSVDGTTIKVDAAGEISAVVPDPMTYKGNINPTTEDGRQMHPHRRSVGDAYTVSWGERTSKAPSTTAPTGLSAIKGSDTTATLGDLLIINSGDGSGAGEWTLVKTGTVDNSASIRCWRRPTASFPPASPKEGDVWYNLDDGRTYVLIQDGGGQNEWVDVSPQGNQMLWKQDTAGVIEPQTNTDALKIPKLATNSTAGTRIAMVDANQTFVANAVGDGLMIDGGVLQVRSSGSGSAINNLQNVTNAGAGTTNRVLLQGGASFNSWAQDQSSAINQGTIQTRRDDASNVWIAYQGGNTGANVTSSISASGGAIFAGGNTVLSDNGQAAFAGAIGIGGSALELLTTQTSPHHFLRLVS